MSNSKVSDTCAPRVSQTRVQSRDAAASPVQVLFHVTASADPGFLTRLIEPFAKLGLTPSRVYASCEDGDGSELTIDLRLASASRCEADAAERMVRAVTGVRQVIVVKESDAA